MRWRNILTAPKDKRILVCGKHWSDSQGPLKEAVIAQWNPRNERWEAGTGNLGRYGIRPTHWQPLPDVFSTSPMDPKHMIHVETGRSLALHDAMKVVLEHEKIPFDVVVGPSGYVLSVEREYLDKLTEVGYMWRNLQDSICRAIFNATVNYRERRNEE